MAASADQNPSRTAGDDRNLVTIDENYLAPTFEDKVLIFWEKNSRTVIALVVIVALAIVGRWGFAMFAASRERAVAADYAAAKDSASLQAFAKANPSAALSGVAHLRLADEAYAKGDFAAAQSDYTAAAAVLAKQPLGDRARLGVAVSKLQAGDAAGAKAALEALANDTTFSRTLRCEAGFHLALIARDAGQTAEAKKWIELVLSAEPSGLWAQRAMQLRSSLPADAAPAPIPVSVTPATTAVPVSTSEAAPAVSFPAAK